MRTLTTASAPVVRTTNEFGFTNHDSRVLSVTFSGRRTEGGPRETFVVNHPRRGFNCKDGSVSITNRSGNWGNEPIAPAYYRVFDFKPHTIETLRGGLALWEHQS